MKKYSEKEKQQFRTAGNKYLEDWRKARNDAKEKLPAELKEFAEDIIHMRPENRDRGLFKDLSDGLENGKYKKPSDFLKEKCEELFNGFIYPQRKKYVYYAVDHNSEWAYEQYHILRRCFRTADKKAEAELTVRILYNYMERDHFDVSLTDYMSDNMSEEMIAHKYWNYYCGMRPSALACEIDSGNTEMISILKDVINGDSETDISNDIIRGIMLSHSKELHELMGKLLLAARLQEGLRQSICENADGGTVEAFLTIIKVIIDNDLIRFSSIKRAVGTWTGIISDNYEERASDLERISKKSVELIYDCLTDENIREEYLKSEDSMKIYFALWSYGVYEARDMLRKIRDISKNGSRHQLLTAGYAVNNLCREDFMTEIAGDVICNHFDEPDVAAVYMWSFMPNFHHHIFGVLTEQEKEGVRNYNYSKKSDYSKRKYCDLSLYFKNREEAEKFYSVLMKLYNNFSGKKVLYSPIIFPWYGVSLSKSEIAERLVFIASALRDNDKIDEAAEMIPMLESGRADAIELLLTKPETETQKRILACEVCDKETYARERAFEVISCTDISPENYLALEEMLRYKNTEMRSNIIKLLNKQDENALFETVKRLVSDKKEEKRTAGFDIIIGLKNNENKKELFKKCQSLVSVTDKTSSKEKILIEQITKGEENTENVSLFYSEDASYTPVIPKDHIKKAEKVFKKYFHSKNKNDFSVVTEKLIGLFEEHIDDEFTEAYSGETATIGAHQYFRTTYEDETDIPFRNLWEEFYKNEIGSPVLLYRMRLNALSEGDFDEYSRGYGKMLSKLIGEEFTHGTLFPHHSGVLDVLEYLDKKFSDPHEKKLIAAYTAYKLIENEESLSITCTNYGRMNNTGLTAGVVYVNGQILCNTNENKNYISVLSSYQAGYLLNPLESFHTEDTEAIFPIKYLLNNKQGAQTSYLYGRMFYTREYVFQCGLWAFDYIYAAFKGVISEDFFYKTVFENRVKIDYRKSLFDNVVDNVSDIYAAMREWNSPVSEKVRLFGASKMQVLESYTGKSSPEEFSDEDKKLISFCEDIYNKIVGTILSAELKRGDSMTAYSKSSFSINRIYGLENFISILLSLGTEPLERSRYGLYYGGERDVSKRTSLSHLLSVCMPAPDDTSEKLKEMIKDTDITERRIIEAALYSPEWLDIVGEYLGWNGFKSACYYFMAHMNESFDNKRKAVIAKYSPISEDDFNSGAFDINWFRSAYEALGEEHFGIIYDSAKYISDGIKHSRARKYADAALGKMNADETEKIISDKRNKDLLMAYALIPIKDEDDLFARYLFIQKFLKESKKFGSQRSASEKKACGTAMQNLALNAGYADVTRLTLRMETKLIDDSRELFNEKTIDDITVNLNVDENGKSEIICKKDGKILKSIPAKHKKNEYIVLLTETKKNLTEQYRRTKLMFEQAMEDSTEFTVSEMKALRENPVSLSVIKDLVFVCGKKTGFLNGNKLTDYSGKTSNVKDDAKVITAHPFALYKEGHWALYQKNLFDRKVVQPFKQVFRELYVKTPEESEMKHSLRYAGNQIQPAKTVACLKTRRWVADVEDGLQKVYYKENIVARIYALADWFSPADIEAPTLEWVEFSDRKTGEELAIKDIPDIIFSEVMRDVDLAVSVAHAGGVDPETSHSTIEMRAALLEFTLRLFKLANVEIKGSHAHITGKRADYTLHLGSGVIHKKGVAMLAILPVHSEHRGKLFLPFADDDPKTAEIITKALFLAEDDKIKDPSILEQINR